MIKQDRIRALQDIIDTSVGADFNLPRIAVLGSQSSGKSSVLEQILQKDFLPRGNNLVTRCPIIISLKKAETSSCRIDGADVDFNQIPHALMAKMAQNCGSNKGIVDRPISVQLRMPNTLDLVLVDLPGLTKIPVGDQPSDIEEQILAMARKYISGSNTLILCVVAANADIATSESLKIAREVDPHYERTIGVLTKIDLMDEGTDCTETLDNTHPALRYGYVGIINRSQADINNGVSVEAALEKEMAKFRALPPYAKYGDAIGSKFLLKKLCDIFLEIFERELPRIRVLLKNAIEALQRELGHASKQNDVKFFLDEYVATLHNFVGANRDTAFEHARSNHINAWCRDVQGYQFHVKLEDLDAYIDNNQYLLLPDRAFEQKVADVSKRVFEELVAVCETGLSNLIAAVEGIAHPASTEAAQYLNSLVVGKLRTRHVVFREELLGQKELHSSFVNLAHPDFNRHEIISRKVMDRVSSMNSTWRRSSEEEIIFTSGFIKELTALLVYEYTSIFMRDIKDVSIKLVHSKIAQFISGTICPEILQMESDPRLRIETAESQQLQQKLKEDIQRLQDAVLRLQM
ncbi:dynamin 1/3 [Pancytospora philotis]|nr:dynamin 1/3 [Pancytospora philotis]